jgi:uncharacterized protein (DUF983 family)
MNKTIALSSLLISLTILWIGLIFVIEIAETEFFYNLSSFLFFVTSFAYVLVLTLLILHIKKQKE